MTAAPTKGGWRFWTARIDDERYDEFGRPYPGTLEPMMFSGIDVHFNPDDWDLLQDASLLTARCHKKPHVAPAPDCSCGFRLVPDVRDLAAYVKWKYFEEGAPGGNPLPKRYRGFIAFAWCEGLDITRPSPTPDDPPGTLLAQTLRIKALYLTTECDPNVGHPRGYGTHEQWANAFTPAVVVAPPPPRPITGGWEYQSFEQWVEWIRTDWAAREAAMPQGDGSARDEASP